MDDPVKQPALSNSTVRLLSAMTLIPIVLLGARIGGVVWLALLLVLAVVGGIEFYLLASGRWSQGSALTGIPMIVLISLAFYVQEPLLVPLIYVLGSVVTLIVEIVRHPNDLRQSIWQVITTLAGVTYVGIPVGCLVALRGEDDGFLWLMVLFAATWGTDTFAYFGGRAFGKHKLSPKLSPNKTIEGAVIGVIGGIIPAMLFLAYGDKLNLTTFIMIAIAPFIAIAGDLFESALKRFFKVKDSHVAGLNIIPGHGGVLDRVDALLMVTVFFYVYLTLTASF
ncbi:MAG: phosphatidate cytidylyltransferase [Aggregatilineales bacterium]